MQVNARKQLIIGLIKLYHHEQQDYSVPQRGGNRSEMLNTAYGHNESYPPLTNWIC